MGQATVNIDSSKTASKISAQPKSPYIGLETFGEETADYFFGRDRDIDVVCMNLRASRLTILYGESGVGKSSMLSAGVVPKLRKLTMPHLSLPDEPPGFLPVVLSEWSYNPVESLNKCIKETVEEALKEQKFPNLSEFAVEKAAFRYENNLNNLLEDWTNLIETKLLIIFDQFEDFFTHPEYFTGLDAFSETFTQAVNNTKLPVNFMLSLRDDALAKLDFFKGKFQEPMSNTLRLNHLSRASAKDAICKPIDRYNEEYGESFIVDDDLVKQILKDVKLGKVRFETQGQAKLVEFSASDCAAKDSDDNQIEAPYLQLVLKRLWDDKNTQREKRLTKYTLTNDKRLGGVQKIVETHLDEVIDRFSPSDKNLISKFIHFTVTRSGMKIPLSPRDLAGWADLPEKREDNIKQILERLSSKDTRIFKSVQNLKTGENKYEVSHDALAHAILSWRKRYVEHTEKRKNRVYFRIIGVILLVSIVLAIYGWARVSVLNARLEMEEAKLRALRAEQISEEAIRNNMDKEQISQYKERKFSELGEALVLAADNNIEKKKEGFDKLDQLINQENIEIPDQLRPLILELLKTFNVDQTKTVDLEKLAEVRRALRTPTPSPPDDNQERQLQAVIYIHILDDAQRSKAKSIERILESDKFSVPKIRLVSNVSLNNTQVRYFRQVDAYLAEEVVGILAGQGVRNVQMQYLPGLENTGKIRAKLEIWLASNTVAENSNSNSR
jgi:cell division protein FtsB